MNLTMNLSPLGSSKESWKIDSQIIDRSSKWNLSSNNKIGNGTSWRHAERLNRALLQIRQVLIPCTLFQNSLNSSCNNLDSDFVLKWGQRFFSQSTKNYETQKECRKTKFCLSCQQSIGESTGKKVTGKKKICKILHSREMAFSQ